jgi:UDP-2,3-diacylglucosamine pyrophosphatase LpxH
MRGYFGTHFGGIEVVPQADFKAADGKRYLVTHGDQYDTVVMNAKWLAHVGDRVYSMLIWLNPKFNALRYLWTRKYWSLSKWAKQQVKQAVNFISQYEEVLSTEAKKGGYDGVICGHIHHAALRDIGDVTYVNTGDWVESCTAVIEEPDGTLRLIDWEARISRKRQVARRAKRRQRANKSRELV